ncbi:MAG: outer membrane protein [Roseiarcus sp.]|jgi:outer membrane immunogenic protein
MRKILLSAVTFAALAGPALAADLPTTKGAPTFVPPPAFSWTGFYVGANAGWASLDDHGSPFCVAPGGVLNGAGCITNDVLGAHANANGFLAGAQAGYNWQANQIVLGLETDFQGAALKGSVNTVAGLPANSNFVADERLSWLGTARGRLGFLVTPTLLLYGTGGLAYGRVNVDQNTIFPGVQYPSSASATKAGWTAGGGVEYAISNNWTVKAEGLFYDLGSISTSGGPVPAVTGFLGGKTFSVEGAIARAGLNYKF